MKNLHLIPTDKPSRLFIDDGILELDTECIISEDWWIKNQNIYITSDEEIKEGDWMLRGNEQPTLVTPNFFWDFGVRYYKIILTTDLQLIQDGVQPIDDEFLEWFVKNPSCESVEVIDDKNITDDGMNVYNIYKIVIPKEEPKQEWSPTQGEEVWIKVFSNWSKGTYVGYDVTKETHIVREDEEGGGHLMSSSQVLPYYEMPNKPKQEILEKVAFESSVDYKPFEEVAANLADPNLCKTDNWIAGAKQQQERMYSEEDMREVILTSFLLGVDRGSYSKELEDKLIEQFKNN
jgi:hypothetical protein